MSKFTLLEGMKGIREEAHKLLVLLIIFVSFFTSFKLSWKCHHHE